MKPYEIVNDEYLELIEGPFQGITFKYGGVQFIPDESNCTLRLKFDYNIIDGIASDVKAFEQYIGDILVDLIDEGAMQNQLIFTGGVNE